MKLKITENTIDKKTPRIIHVKHLDTNSYKVHSLILKKKDVTKTVFI